MSGSEPKFWRNALKPERIYLTTLIFSRLSNTKQQLSTSWEGARAWGHPRSNTVIQGLPKTEVKVETIIKTFKYLKPYTKPKITIHRKNLKLKIKIAITKLNFWRDWFNFSHYWSRRRKRMPSFRSKHYLSLHGSFTHDVYNSIKITRHTKKQRK